MTTTVKTCFKCLMQKSHDAFYRHSAMGDGRLGKCIECTKADVAKNRLENIDKIREYDRARSDLPHRVELRYRVCKRWREEHPDRDKAHYAVTNAVRDKRLFKSDACLYCGSTGRLEGHHTDYSRPLDVVWLCVPCHRQTHAMAKSLEQRMAA